jgi:hypothetical protein
LVLRRIVALRGISSPVLAIQRCQKPLQLFFGANCDTRKPRSKIFAALANQDSVPHQAAKESRPGLAKIGQQKIAGAGEYANLASL